LKLGNSTKAIESLERAQALSHPHADSLLEMVKIANFAGPPADRFRLGDRVRIKALGRSGTIAEILMAGPYVVRVDGTSDKIYAEFWELILLHSLEQALSDSSDDSHDQDEIQEDDHDEHRAKQIAFELDATNPHTAAVSQRCDSDLNAAVGEMVLKRQLAKVGIHVLLLKVSRRPGGLREALLASPDLSPCRHALEEHGFAVKLRSGAYVFVRPENYQPTMEAIRLQGRKLYPNNIIADVELEKVVKDVVRSLPGRDKVYTKRGVEVIPLAFPSAVASSNYRVSVRRTFIDISVPSSLCSAQASGQRTASTTDAEHSKGANPRTKANPKK